MNSQLTSQLGWASKQAQKILGEDFTLGGTTYQGVVRRGEPTFLPGPNGIERIEEITVVATIGQFASAPTAAPRTTAAIGSRAYWLTRVDSDALNYFLTFVPA